MYVADTHVCVCAWGLASGQVVSVNDILEHFRLNQWCRRWGRASKS